MAVIFIWLGAAAMSLILALIIGNAIGDAADKNAGELISGGKPPVYSYAGEEVKPISAHCLNGLTSKAVAALDPSVEAVSVTLRKLTGEPAYHSPLALAVTGNAGGSADLKTIVGELKARGIYVSGVFHSKFGSQSNENLREGVLGYEASLICEALECGVDEIVVMGLPTDSAGVAEASLLFKRVRERHADAVLGAAMPYSLLESGAAAAFIENYSGFASFLAVNTEGLMSTAETSAGLAEKYMIYFERYPLRLVIEAADKSNGRLQMEKLAALGIYNVQCVPVKVN
jgi:hypothetical protein